MMVSSPKRTQDAELKRLQAALEQNEKLMQEAAIKYEDLVGAKQELTAAIKARKETAKKGVTP